MKNEVVLKKSSRNLVFQMHIYISSHLKITFVSKMEFLDLLQNNLEQISKYYDKVIFKEKNVTLLFTTAMYEASVCL